MSATGVTPDGKKRQVGLHNAVEMEMWPTPKASAENYGRPRADDRGDLQAAAMEREMWPTPRCAPASFYAEDPPTAASRGLNSRETLASAAEGPHVPGGKGRQLNPEWVELLMGFPASWTELGDE